MPRLKFVDAPYYNYELLRRHDDVPLLRVGARVKVTPQAFNSMRAYEDVVGELLLVIKVARKLEPFYAYVVKVGSITPEAQETLWHLQRKSYASMPYIMELVQEGQLIFVKKSQLSVICNQDQELSHIDYVAPQRAVTKKGRQHKSSSSVLAPAKAWSEKDVAMVASWQLGMWGTSAQLALNAASYASEAGGAPGAADVVVVGLSTKDETSAALQATWLQFGQQQRTEKSVGRFMAGYREMSDAADVLQTLCHHGRDASDTSSDEEMPDS